MMIRENQLTQWGGLNEIECWQHKIRREFMRGFNPNDEEWRGAVVSRGCILFQQGIVMLR